MPRRWLVRAAVALFALALIYPLTGIMAPIGPWQWSTLEPVRVSIGLTTLAMLIVVLAGTPVAVHIAAASTRERLVWQALLLVSILLPPLALGILLSIAFGSNTLIGHWLINAGVRTTNSRVAFVGTQVYVSIGYYVLGAVAAFEAVPSMLKKHAALLGQPPLTVFRRITFPLARLGLAVALSVAWVRALGEFGAVMVTSYYPAGMPVQIWVNLQSFGLPSVMPLLVIFLAAALPLPWLIHLLAQRRPHA